MNMPESRTLLSLTLMCYWLVTGAACDTFLEAEGTITLKDPLSEQFAGKRLIGVWAIEATSQSASTSAPGGDLCESIGVPCSVVLQGIDVFCQLQGEDETPVLNAEAHDRVISSQTDYPFKLSNIHGPGEKGRFARNYIGAFIDIDDNGQWDTTEPFGWAIENPLSRRCVDRRSSDHQNCIELNVLVE